MRLVDLLTFRGKFPGGHPFLCLTFKSEGLTDWQAGKSLLKLSNSYNIYPFGLFIRRYCQFDGIGESES